MAKQEALLISATIKAGTIRPMLREGVTGELFAVYSEEIEWLLKQKVMPSRETFMAKFPGFRWRGSVKVEEISILIADLKENYLKVQVEGVLEKAAKRLDKLTGEELAHLLQDESHRILATSGTGGATEVIMGGDKYLKQFRRRQKNRLAGVPEGIQTGLKTIDNHTGGLQDAHLYVTLARLGQAKTYFMLYCAARSILDGKRVLWTSREMPDDMVAYRVHTIMSSLLRGPDNSFSNLGLILGKEDVNYDDYRKFVTDMKKNIKGRLYIPDRRNVAVRSMGEYVERFSADIAFYDYLGIVADGEGERSWQKLAEEANVAKEVAMQFNIPMMVAAQANRKAADVNEAPMLENIAYSDAIGQASDLVFSLLLERNSNDPSAPRMLEIWMRKHRYGAQDAYCLLEFRGDAGSLIEVDSGLDIGEDEESTRRRKKKKKSKVH